MGFDQRSLKGLSPLGALLEVLCLGAPIVHWSWRYPDPDASIAEAWQTEPDASVLSGLLSRAGRIPPRRAPLEYLRAQAPPTLAELSESRSVSRSFKKREEGS